MTIMNWFRTKADLIAKLSAAETARDQAFNAALHAQGMAGDTLNKLDEARKTNVRLNASNVALANENERLRKQIAEAAKDAYQRREALRAAARKGAAVTNAKRAALKAVA